MRVLEYRSLRHFVNRPGSTVPCQARKRTKEMFWWLRSNTKKFHALLNKDPLNAGVNSKSSSSRSTLGTTFHSRMQIRNSITKSFQSWAWNAWSRSEEETKMSFLSKPHKHRHLFTKEWKKIPIYRKERTALTFSASLPLLKWNHRRKGLQIDVGKLRKKIKVLFLFSAVQLIHVISIFVVIEQIKRV